MRDDEFLLALETGTLPLAAFDHRAHVRAGYLYLKRHGLGGAIERFSGALKALAARHGKDGLYHERYWHVVPQRETHCSGGATCQRHFRPVNERIEQPM